MSEPETAVSTEFDGFLSYANFQSKENIAGVWANTFGSRNRKARFSKLRDPLQQKQVQLHNHQLLFFGNRFWRSSVPLMKSVCWISYVRYHFDSLLQIQVLCMRNQAVCTSSKVLLYVAPWRVEQNLFSPMDAKIDIILLSCSCDSDNLSETYNMSHIWKAKIAYNIVWQHTLIAFSTFRSLNFVINGPSVRWIPGVSATFLGAFKVSVPSFVPSYLIFWSNFFVTSITFEFLTERDAMFGPFVTTTSVFTNFQHGSCWVLYWFLGALFSFWCF